jgi:uncharacterized protein (TIGR03437 family)
VYLFDNCLEDPNQPVEVLANDLDKFLNSIQYDNGTQVPQIDLVAHSMGGLIARAYLAGLQTDQSFTPPATMLVRKLVLIATPNFGSFVAANYNFAISPGTASAELIPGSSLLWNLATWNQRGDDLRGVDAVAVIGNAGSYLPSLQSNTALSNASDGLVSLTSASLGFIYATSPATRIVPYCHIDPGAFINTNFGTFLCNAAGIANVNSQSHLTGRIVRSFLAGTSDWTSIGTTPANDAYLSKNGGMFFTLVNATGSYVKDMTAVKWGTVALQNGANTNTIYYQDFISGGGNYQATSTSLGTINCGTLTLPAGFFSAARCKVSTVITSISPNASTTGRQVNAGATLTIGGLNFGTQCNGCQVLVTPSGSTTGQPLQVTSWTATSIQATLPSTLTGLYTLTVKASSASDSMPIMVASASAATIAAAPASLEFSSADGTAPPAQTIQITNSGAGTLDWTATASDSWLSVSPASGTAPSTVTVSVSPAGLSAGTYTGNVRITSSGASNTPLTVGVTLTVAASPASLAVAPQSLAFSYSAGGAVPPAQDVSITNTGGGILTWTASAGAFWIDVSPASGGAPGTLAISVNPANLAAGTYTSTVRISAAGAGGSPAAVAISLTVTGTQPAGSITSVANAGSFQPGFAPGTWLSIFGANLSQRTATWQASDFVNGTLPASLDGVSVTVNGMPAYVEYISPTQINVLAPDDAPTGAVQVQVTTAQQMSNSVTAQKQQFAPAFFTIGGGAYVAAVHADYTLVGKPGLLAGVTTQPAAPGETIVLYGTGFGPTNPPLPSGQLVTTPAPLANMVQIGIGGMNAPVAYAGLVEAGLYQFNVTVPAGLPSGDAAVAATIGGVQTQTGVSIALQQ